jgi:large subunit ribosomal protein L10
VDAQFLFFNFTSMPITKSKKREIVKNLADKFIGSKSVVFLNFQGLTVKESMELRRKLRNENVDYKVSKKTLIKRSLKEAKYEDVDGIKLDGPIAVAVSKDDETAPARLVSEYSKINNKLQILGGFVALKYMDAQGVKALALLPNKEQLRAQLVSTINSSISGFVNVLSGNMKEFVNVLKAISDTKKS